MTIYRHILGFENNPEVVSLLQEQFPLRREIDRDLGIRGAPRLFTLDFGGSDFIKASAQSEFGSLAELQEAMDKRNADSRWKELNQALFQAGLKVTFNGIARDRTPD